MLCQWPVHDCIRWPYLLGRVDGWAHWCSGVVMGGLCCLVGGAWSSALAQCGRCGTGCVQRAMRRARAIAVAQL